MSTSLRLIDVYADRLHAALLEYPVLTLDDLWRHPALAGFAQVTRERIVELLQHDARISDDAYGRLHVAPLKEAA